MVTVKLSFQAPDNYLRRATKVTGLRTECKASGLTATLTVPSMKDSGGTINITEMGFYHSQTGRGMKGNGKITLCRGLASLLII
jgi:hypothetical protein